MNELLLLLAQEGGAGPAAAGDALTVQSVWDFVVKGGLLMIPIGACSVVALTVVVERLVSLRRRAVMPDAFVSGLRELLGGGGDREKALARCREDGSPVAAVLAAGIRKLGEPPERVEKAVQEAGEREAVRLSRFGRVLAVIASVAPLLGLLGTIFGMIKAFQTVALSGDALGKTELLAGGIYEAMITTAAGLIVAIPTLVCHHWIAARVDRRILEIDRLVVEFLEEFVEGGGRAAAVRPATPIKLAGS